jgi:hypothetical protein
MRKVMIVIKQALLIGLLSDVSQRTFQGKLCVGLDPRLMLSPYIIFLSPAIRL